MRCFVVAAAWLGLGMVALAAETAAVAPAEVDARWAQVYDRPEKLKSLRQPVVCLLDIQHPEVIRQQLQDPAKPLDQARPVVLRRRLRELSGLDCLVLHQTEVTGADLDRPLVKAIVIGGRSKTLSKEKDAEFFPLVRNTRIPLLGICGGCQLIGQAYEAKVAPLRKLRADETDPNPKYHPGLFKEWGFMEVQPVKDDPLLASLPKVPVFKEMHAYQMVEPPADFELLASTAECRVEAIKHKQRLLYGVQFHPEAYDDTHLDGRQLLANFFRMALAKVRPQPPYVVWFQPKQLADKPQWYRSLTVDGGGTELPAVLARQGALGLAWAYGINNEYAKGPDYWRDICGPEYRRWAGLGRKAKDVTNTLVRPGVALDEWCNPAGPQAEAWAAEGLRAGRKQWPDCFIAVWVTELTDPLAELVRDGTVDLLIFECYTHAPARMGPGPFSMSLPGVYHRMDKVAKAGLLDKSIICLGHITDEPDLKGRVLTADGLRKLADDLRRRYPQCPGIAFYQAHGRDSAEELIRACDAIGAEVAKKPQ